MRYVMILLAMAGLTLADAYMWWDWDDPVVTEFTGFGMCIDVWQHDLDSVGSAIVYTETYTAAQNANMYWADYVGGTAVDVFTKHSITDAGSLGYEVRFDWGGAPHPYIIITTSGEWGVDRFRCVEVEPGTSHTWIQGSYQNLEACLIVYDDPVSLQRESWGSIKASF